MKPFIQSEEIRKRVQALGEELDRHYQEKPLVVVGILKGSFVFMADLIRAMKIPLRCDFVRVSSYEGQHSSGDVKLDLDVRYSVSNQHLLIVEDIVDSGRTLLFLKKHFEAKGALSVRYCSLLLKEPRKEGGIHPDYTGFMIPDFYVVGYGMDESGLYRSLPDICVLEGT